MRGPMASKVINQLLLQTDWGDLDVLVLDTPPGTGDIQITLSQTLSLSGTVIVTTPQKLSLVDVVKGIKMFDDLKVRWICYYYYYYYCYYHHFHEAELSY